MESKTVVKWSWVAVQETFNRKCLPLLSLLHPLFNVGVPFFKCQSTWQHWRAEGTGGGTELSGILRVGAWPHSLRFYFRSTVKHITHEPLQWSILWCKLFYLTSQEQAWWEQGQVLELRFHFPSRACFLTHWVCFWMYCRVKLGLSPKKKRQAHVFLMRRSA